MTSRVAQRAPLEHVGQRLDAPADARRRRCPLPTPTTSVASSSSAASSALGVPLETRTRSAAGRCVAGAPPRRAGRVRALPGVEHARSHRRHLRLRARGDQRHDAAAEGRLVLQDAALVVDGEIDAFAGRARGRAARRRAARRRGPNTVAGRITRPGTLARRSPPSSSAANDFAAGEEAHRRAADEHARRTVRGERLGVRRGAGARHQRRDRDRRSCGARSLALCSSSTTGHRAAQAGPSSVSATTSTSRAPARCDAIGARGGGGARALDRPLAEQPVREQALDERRDRRRRRLASIISRRRCSSTPSRSSTHVGEPAAPTASRIDAEIGGGAASRSASPAPPRARPWW